MLVFLQRPNSDKLGEIQDANVQVSVEASASLFNAGNGYWEPLLEPWRVSTSIGISRAPDVNDDDEKEHEKELKSREDSQEEFLEEHEHDETPSTERTRDIGDRSGTGDRSAERASADDERNQQHTAEEQQASPVQLAPMTTILLTSHEPFELNLSPMMLGAAHSALLLLDRVAYLGETKDEASDGQRAAMQEAVAQRAISSSLNTKLLGLCNKTELPITFDVQGRDPSIKADTKEVASGEAITFEDINGWTHDHFGVRTIEPSETSESLELVRAARYGQVDMVAELLRRYANPNSHDPVKKRTALHAASKHKHVAIVKMLLRAGANVELTTADGAGMRALHFAASRGSMDIVRELLEAGADPAAANAEGRNAASLAKEHPAIQSLLYERLSSGATASGTLFPSAELVLAASRGNFRAAVRLLRAQADPNSTDGQLTALQRAAAERNHKLVSLLLQTGADVNMVSASGLTALLCAARAGPLKTVERLLDGNANPLQAHAFEGLLPVETVSTFRTQQSHAVHTLLCCRSKLAAPVSGWLMKLGGERRTWKRRFCMLTTVDPLEHGQLRYFSDENLSNLHGAIDLSNVLPDHLAVPSQCPDIAHRRALSFDLCVGERTYVFVADDEAQLALWLDMLRLLFVRTVTNQIRRVQEQKGLVEAGQAAKTTSGPSASVASASGEGSSADAPRFAPPDHLKRSLVSGQSSALRGGSLSAGGVLAATNAVATVKKGTTFTRRGGNALTSMIFGRSSGAPRTGSSSSSIDDTAVVGSVGGAVLAGAGAAVASGGVGAAVVGGMGGAMVGASLTSPQVMRVGEGDVSRLESSAFLQPFLDELDETEAAHESKTHGAITLHVGHAASRSFLPLSRISMRSLGAKLHILRASDANRDVAVVGLIAEVAYTAGIRTLTLRSTVHLENGTDVAIEMSPQHPPNDEAALQCTRVVPPGDMAHLPLMMTGRGSADAIWGVKLRPVETSSDDASNLVGATLLPPTLFSEQSAAVGRNDALLICPSTNPAGKPWAACVAIGYETSTNFTEVAGSGAGDVAVPGGNLSASLSTIGGDGGGLGSSGGSVMSDGQRTIEVNKRYRLPATESLLHQYSCLVPEGPLAISASVKGEVNLTRHFLCWGRAGQGSEGALLWSKVSALSHSTVVTVSLETIEISLHDGRRISFSGFKRRDEALAAMRETHACAISDRELGVVRWLPHALKMTPPLTVQNLLPCSLHVRVTSISMTSAQGTSLGWPVLPGTMNPDGAWAEFAGGVRSSAGMAVLNCLLESGESTNSNDVASLGPIEIEVELRTPRRRGHGNGEGGEELNPASDDDSDNGGDETSTKHESRVGRLVLHRPLDRLQEELVLTVKPPSRGRKGPSVFNSGMGTTGRQSAHGGESTANASESSGTASGDRGVRGDGSGGKSHAVDLVCLLKAGSAGSLQIAITCAHWVENDASVPLKLYDASLASNFDPIAEVEAHYKVGCPFSLSREGKASCRIAIPSSFPRSKRRRTRLPISAPTALDHGMKFIDGRLSKQFSASATGSEGVVEVVVPGNSLAAELVVQLSAAAGKLERSGATVMTISDRLLIYNRTSFHLEVSQYDDRERRDDGEAATCSMLSSTESASQPSCGSTASPAASSSTKNTAAAHGLAPGEKTPIFWRSSGSGKSAGSTSRRRLLSIRCVQGHCKYEWSAPFNPNSVGESILKLRPSTEHRNLGDRPSSSQQAMYLRLTVTMLGLRRLTIIRPMADTTGRVKLPYRISNRSPRLLAFCQKGCEHGSDEHWDLLGAGESCDYAWDRPLGARSIVVRARDVSGRWTASTGSGKGLPLEKVVASLGELKLRRASQQKSDLGEPTAHSIMAQLAPEETDSVLMTVAGELWCGSETYAKGWLAVTREAISFIFFSQAQAAAAIASNGIAGSTSPSPVPVSALPLPLNQVVDTKLGVQGELVVISSSGKELIVALMRDAATSLTRLQSILDSREATTEAELTRQTVQQHLARVAARESLGQLGGSNSSSQGDTSNRRASAATRLQALLRSRNARRRLSVQAIAADAVSPSGVSDESAGDDTGYRTVASMAALRLPTYACPELVDAARGGDHWRVSSLLFGRADPDSVDWRGMAAIHACCTSDRPASLAILAELLAFGADVEMATRDRWRLRPLHVAGRVAYGATVARALLAFGATPLSTSADGKRAVEQASPSNLAVLAVLRRSGAVWTATKGPKVLRAALVTAVASGRLLRMAELLAHRTSPDSYDQHGASALHVACACADADAIRALLAAGASANLSMRDGSGRRPLHISASLGASRCARLLLSSGADVLLADERQRLPLDYCRSDDKFVRALLMRALLTKGLSSGRRRSQTVGVAATAADGDAHPAAISAWVISDGPIKELRLVDKSSVEVAEHVATLSASRRTRSGATRAGRRRASKVAKAAGGGWVGGAATSSGAQDTVARGQVRVEAIFSSLGLTLIDSEPSEVVRLCMQNLIVRASASRTEHAAELKIGHLQVDSCVRHTRFQVMLTPQPASPEDAENAEVVHMIVSHDPRWLPTRVFHYIGAQLAPLRLDIEQNTVTRLLRFASQLSIEWEKAATAHSEALMAGIDRSHTSRNAQAPTAAVANARDDVLDAEGGLETMGSSVICARSLVSNLHSRASQPCLRVYVTRSIYRSGYIFL